MLMSMAISPSDVLSQSSEDSVLVTLQVHAGYDDSDHSIEEISQLLEQLPYSITAALPNDNLPRLILRLYRVSDAAADGKQFESRLPVTYRLIRDFIVATNDLSDETDLKEGDTLLVPSLPPLASKGNDANPYNAIPAVRRFNTIPYIRRLSDSSETALSVLLRDPIDSITSEAGKGQQTVQLEFWLPKEKALDLEAIGPHYAFRMSRERWSANLSPARHDPIPRYQVLESRDSNEIAIALNTKAQRDGLVLILDSGWPDSAAADRSVKYLRALFDITRKRWKMPPAAGREELPKFEMPTNEHCIRVAEALKDLELLDRSEKVKVIFVPNTREQNGRVVLEELLYLYEVIKLKRAAALAKPNLVPEKMLIDIAYRREATRVALQKVASLPPNTPADAFYMDADVVQALIEVVNTAVESERRAAMFSESWTVQQNVVSLALPEPFAGVTVVSAGNENGRNVFRAPRVDFAQRSANGFDYLTVMTMDSTGTRCGSSEAVSQTMEYTLTTGFNGWLPSLDCGTSFAAPRVAWLLAAAEAVRAGSEPFYGTQVLRRLLEMRRSWTGDAKGQLLFSPRILFGNQNN
jgi:hypothetical protein